LAELQRLLASTRLLTLTGSGGCGKTRLSLHLAADSLERFPDGAWLVELAPLADAELVPQTVASVLGLKGEPGKPIGQSLIAHLKDKRLLLMLDNCEHLLDGCAKLVGTLVGLCPAITVLASSREALGIAGEQAYRVPSLALPDPGHVDTSESVAAFEAVQLFTDRARLARPDFQVSLQNAAALASICHRLDGIPLAIELAAARVRSLSIDEINRKLDQRFQLLTGGSRTALPRQQTLRSLIDWSYDLLSDREGQLLQRLSVFLGGWTLAAAEQVCADDGVADNEVLDLLASLCDKSLVLVDENDGSYRYRLLETVRQYARERLLTSGGGESVRARHRDFFLALAEETHAKLKGPEQAMWLRRLEAEHENLRASLEWSLVDAGLNAGLRLCGALQYFWIMRGHFSEGRRWCDRVLASSRDAERTAERANALSAAGLLAYRQDDFAAARALLEESLAISRQLGDRKSIGVAAGNLGMVALDEGNLVAARALHEESLAIARELGNRNGVLASLGNLGIVSYELGDFAAARTQFEEILAISRELGDGQTTAIALHRLGTVEDAQGGYRAAEALYRESLTILHGLGLRGRIPYSLQELAMVAAALGNPLRAARLWGAEERLREEIGPARSAGQETDPQMRDARAAAGDGAAFDRAWQEGRAMPLEQAIEFAISSGHA
jgi:non-specific serine/threonine protein kinase